MLGAFSFAMIVKKINTETCISVLYFVFIAFLVIALLSIAGFSPFQTGGKPMVVYSEPSHYALSVLPFLFFIIIQANPKNKIIYLLLAFEVALIIQSLTLMAGIVLISIIASQVRTALIVVGMFVTLYYIAPLIHSFLNLIFPSSPIIEHHQAASTYIDGRLDKPTLAAASKSVNGSFLVYLSGWERPYLNFIDYFGFGSGFQQLGIVGDKGIAMERLINVYGRSLGLLDGGAVAAKFLSEFGLFALLLLGFTLNRFLHKLKNYK